MQHNKIVMNPTIPKMTEQDFIDKFGCDRATYDRKLSCNMDRILRERDRVAENTAILEHEKYIMTFKGKFVYYKNRVLPITDIRYCAGYPEDFPMYYGVFSTTESGKEFLVSNFPAKDFHENNPTFTDIKVDEVRNP